MDTYILVQVAFDHSANFVTETGITITTDMSQQRKEPTVAKEKNEFVDNLNVTNRFLYMFHEVAKLPK